MKNKIIFLMLASMITLSAANKEAEFTSLLIAEKVLDLQKNASTGRSAAREYAKKQTDICIRKDSAAKSIDEQRAQAIIQEIKDMFKQESLASNIKKNGPYFNFIFEGKCSRQNVEVFWKQVETLPDSSLDEDALSEASFRIGDSASRPLILQYFKDIKYLHDYYVKK